ncbi:MAG: tyrosine-type recombinase/integrase [Lentimicrobiaceae bacterium]|nr:tyrosine-type recombinase/integrase [Lentimicrobiaceae bacterium]
MQEKIKQYLEWKGTYAPRASVNYKIWLERFIKVCGDKPLEEYNISDYVKYKNWIENHYSSYCVQYATIVIKNFLKFYRDQDYKCLSPSFIRIPQIKAKSHRAITEVEFKKIVSNIPENDFRSLRDLLIIRLLWDTGIRVSELCDLDISQINENSRSAVIHTKKTKNQRIIVWSEETHYYLKKYISLRIHLRQVSNVSALFISLNRENGWGSRLAARSVQRIIKQSVIDAGIKEKITPHSFRHGWAHKRRDQNAPLAFIQRGLGHINPISTFIYEQYNDNEFVKNANFYLRPA